MGLTLAMLIAFPAGIFGCGGSGSSANETPADPVVTSLKSFIDKYNALSEFDPSTASGGSVVTPLNEMVAAGDVLISELESYNAEIEAYEQNATFGNGTGSAMLLAKQSVDPQLIVEIGALIEAGRTEADAINALIQSGADDDEAHSALNSYKQRHMGNAFKTGMTAIVGGGAGAIAGLAAASAGAPVLVITGVGIGVGMAVGAVWSWCTSSSSMTLGKAVSSGETCSLAAVKGEVVTLENGEKGVGLTLPQGSGRMCLHINGKAPLCIETTITSDGVKVTTSCFADENDTESIQGCNDGALVGAIDIISTDCSKISSINASATVSGGATVTVHTSPPTSGCAIESSLVGTDNYTQPDNLTTGGSGTASFSVPGGDDGVHDTVTITAPASGVSTTIGYTF